MSEKTDLDELDRLHAAATEGEWTVLECRDCVGYKTGSSEHVLFHSWTHTLKKEADRDLVVALHNAYPSLSAELRELRAENSKLTKALQEETFLHSTAVKHGTDAEMRAEAAEARVKVLEEALRGADKALAGTYWTSDDGEEIRDSDPEESGAPKWVLEKWLAIREALSTAPASPWRDISTAPTNEAILVAIPNAEHYGPSVYRALLVAMGHGKHWLSTGWHVGRDVTGEENQPTHWMPLPPAPNKEGGYP